MTDEVATIPTPLSAVEIVNLQQRVLRGEDVSDEELKAALESLAHARSGASLAAAAKKSSRATTTYNPTESVADRFAKFKANKAT